MFAGGPSTEAYRSFLCRTYSFLAPVERSLLDTRGLDAMLDTRRFRKHLLIEHDLRALGMRSLELQAVPQCMWVPWFEDPFRALGWAFLVERNTLAHPQLFRALAAALPGEAAFAASFLKCYSGEITEMWQGFTRSLDVVVVHQGQLDRVVEGARSAFRHFRRWRHYLDGKSLSTPPGAHPTLELPPLTREES